MRPSFYFSLELVWVCELEISHIGKKNGNSNLVCENLIICAENHPLALQGMPSKNKR